MKGKIKEKKGKSQDLLKENICLNKENEKLKKQILKLRRVLEKNNALFDCSFEEELPEVTKKSKKIYKAIQAEANPDEKEEEFLTFLLRDGTVKKIAKRREEIGR